MENKKEKVQIPFRVKLSNAWHAFLEHLKSFNICQFFRSDDKQKP